MSTLMRRLDRMLGRRGNAEPAAAEIRPITERLDALEAMVEALQDSADRQARRYDERLNELERRLQPSQLARSLADDARKRGL